MFSLKVYYYEQDMKFSYNLLASTTLTLEESFNLVLFYNLSVPFDPLLCFISVGL